MTGIVRDSGGTPAAGIPVAVTRSEGDIACLTPSARGVTDSAGRFHLPAVREQKRIFWFAPIENFGTTWYRFCAGGAPTTTPQQVAAMAASTHIMGFVRGDTLDCIQWTLRGSARVSCNGPVGQSGTFTFGAWHDARDSGYYRLLRADEDTRRDVSRAVVQWIAVGSDASAGTRVRSELELPTGEPIVGATYAIRNGRVVARVESLRRTKWNNRRWLAFELGGPGEARQVPDH